MNKLLSHVVKCCKKMELRIENIEMRKGSIVFDNDMCNRLFEWLLYSTSYPAAMAALSRIDGGWGSSCPDAAISTCRQSRASFL